MFDYLVAIALFVLVVLALWLTFLVSSIIKSIMFIRLSLGTMRDMSQTSNARIDNVFNLAIKQAEFINTLTEVVEQLNIIVRALYMVRPEEEQKRINALTKKIVASNNPPSND